jgi:hypothetical protein
MPFVKGQSGNPKGRPPAVPTFARVLRAQLDAVRDGSSTRDLLAAVVVDKALAGDLDAVKWIVDRVDGKVPDRLEAGVDARVTPAIDEPTRLAVLAHAARRRALARGAG